MNCIIIDTSTEVLHLALGSEGKLIAWESSPHNNKLSALLIPSIHHILQENKSTLQELSYLAVGTGPGSFTGTRIGAIVGMGLSFALGIPLVGFPSSLLNEERFAMFQKIHFTYAKQRSRVAIDYFNCSLS